MAADTHGLTSDLEGKVIKVFFKDGEICNLKLLHLDIHEDCPHCSGYAGIIYDLVGTNRPEKYTLPPVKSAFWADLDEIEHFETVEPQSKGTATDN